MVNNQNIGVLSEKVAHLESDVKTLALPTVTASDEGKSVVVNSSGAWEAANINGDNVIYSEGVSINDKIDSKINPPDLSNITRENLTSDTAMEVISTGKWYCVTAENQSSGSCSAYILDSTNTYYLSATQTSDGEWKRTTTSWLYIPVGEKIYARALFTYRGYLCSASQL